MSLFVRTEDDLEAFGAFTDSLDAVAERLADTAAAQDLERIRRLRDNFIAKTTDFYRENRKLNIGVVGQMKAGKSSFLNTLLFGGEEVLPKASTPKTATLTKMEYGETNRIHIEFYTVEEWDVLVDNASVDLEDEIYRSAKEIVDMVRRSGIQPIPLLEKGSEEREFENYTDLIAALNDFVGEDGRYTPLVKAVTLYLNREEFRDISIVDTPGMNDPIASRTMRTKEFMEVCDVVFFLSPTGRFLDKSDWDLLSSQLPHKGVKRLVLIGSKLDGGLQDVLKEKDEDDEFGAWDDDNSTDNVPEAYSLVTRLLTKRAQAKVAEITAYLRRRGSSDELLAVIEQCREPLFFSSMACNMLAKTEEAYTGEERLLRRALQPFTSDLESDLRMLGNIEPIRGVFDEVVQRKSEILTRRAAGFVPTAIEELRQLLADCRERAEKKLALLTGSDREQLLEQKGAMEGRISAVSADITATFGETLARLEAEKAEAVRELRQASSEYGKLNERTATETKTGSRSYSTSKWYNPFSWGSSKTEHYTYEASYSYLDVADALDNLRAYATEAANEVEQVFTDALQLKELKRKLLTVVIDNFDMGSAGYDAAFFRKLVEDEILPIEFPIVKLDISDTTAKLASAFSGQVRGSAEKTNLQEAQAQAVALLFDRISTKLMDMVKTFKAEMNGIAAKLTESLLGSIRTEFEELLVKVGNREREIAGYRTYLDKLTAEIKRL